MRQKKSDYEQQDAYHEQQQRERGNRALDEHDYHLQQVVHERLGRVENEQKHAHQYQQPCDYGNCPELREAHTNTLQQLYQTVFK
jgi:hypothetical protein